LAAHPHHGRRHPHHHDARHCVTVELRKKATENDILSVWDSVPRIRFVSGKHGIKSSAQVMELARDLGRPRGDFMEIIVWQDGIKVEGNTLYYYQAIHQESDIVPEIVDCVRSMMKARRTRCAPSAKTDKAMGIGEVAAIGDRDRAGSGKRIIYHVRVHSIGRSKCSTSTLSTTSTSRTSPYSFGRTSTALNKETLEIEDGNRVQQTMPT
jgi:hypothetical protein